MRSLATRTSSGVDRGDRRGLKNLLEGYFPEDKIVRQARSAVDEALRPVQEQMKTMLDSLMPKVTWPESMVNPLSQYGDSFTSPMQSVMQTASANMFPDITETIRKVTGIGTMKDSVWDSIYPGRSVTAIYSDGTPTVTIGAAPEVPRG